MKDMIRKAIRQASQCGFLGFYYPPEFPIRTCLQWRMYRHERATIKYLRVSLNSRDVFINVGAHVGYYATYAGRLVGRKGGVFAFEPHPDNYRLLVRNCRCLRQVRAIQAVVSDTDGEALLFEHSTSSSSHGLTDLSGSGKSIPVRKLTLDAWSRENGIDHVDAILIDVEGHELSVLQGMRNIIANNTSIIVIMEYCPSNWIRPREKIGALIKEIYKMQLNVICALGQVERYDIPKYASEIILRNRLDAILVAESNEEHCNYVNIILRKKC